MTGFSTFFDNKSKTYSINGLGNIEMTLFDEVMEPSPFSLFLANNLSISQEAVVLDAGCGSGILSIVLARLRCKKIFAVDISQNSITATEHNALRNNISVGSEGTIVPLQGDLFQPITKHEHCLDAIVSNPPTLAEIPFIPKFYQAGLYGRSFIERLISESPKFLKPNGFLQFTHPFHADIEKTKRLLKEVGFKYKIIACQEIKFHTFHKYHFKYLEQFDLLPDSILKTQDTQDVAIFKAYLEH